MTLQSLLRSIPDFPKPGINFIDITPLLRDPNGLVAAMDAMIGPFGEQQIDLVVGAESRGFIFGTAIAMKLGAGFIPIRKPGKLPAETRSVEYELEYGSDTIEIHADAIEPGQRVLMVDDLLATGGTMRGCCDLVSELGGEIVGISVLIELGFLEGRAKLEPHGPIHSVVVIDGE